MCFSNHLSLQVRHSKVFSTLDHKQNYYTQDLVGDITMACFPTGHFSPKQMYL